MLNRVLSDESTMSLVEQALGRPPGEREAYLRSACADDTELFEQAWHYVQWEQRMDGFLLEPLFPPLSWEHPFAPGDLLLGRFQIVREVDEGGMGIVYEAIDERLEKRIALKCAKPGFGRRLPPEARNAREIGHPNVCKIFEIHTAPTKQGDIDFLTMEFLEGETLAKRLARGPVGDKEARTIALQLCEGLAEAHRKHVIHGDLKSANVILTAGADGAVRTVITDFGLARGLTVNQRTVQSGEAGGTPDYMAPELWKGEKASVASDIYALGVILYELASARRPFPSEVPWKERLNRTPPPLRHKWNRVLTRCLAPDPKQRFQSAEEVARALKPRLRPWLLAAAAAIVLAIISSVFAYETAAPPKESVRLAMLPFEADRDTASLAIGLFRDASGQLARLKGNARTKLTIIPSSKILHDHVGTTENARALLDATHVIHGTLSNENHKIVLHAYLTDARSRVNAKEWKAAYAPEELRYAPVALAGMVTETLHVPPLVIAPAVNALAKQDYWNGLYYLQRNSTIDSALPLLERAVEADPDSPLTYAALAEAQQWKFFLTKDNAWLERAKESARQAEGRNPDLAQVHRVVGVLRYREGFYELAAAELLRTIELDPNNSEAHWRLGGAFEASNQMDQALAEYRRAVEVGPRNYRNHQGLGSFHYQRGDYSQALGYFQKAVELAPEESTPHFGLGQEYLGLGFVQRAESELRTAIRLGETSGEVEALGIVLMDEHRYQEAASCFLRAISLGSAHLYLCWMNLGTVYRLMNLNAESENGYRRSLELAEKEMTRDPRNGKTRSHLAFVCARLGDRTRAESEIAQARAMAPDDTSVRFMAVATYETLQRREDALNVLAGSTDLEFGDVRRWPDMADLVQDPRFQQLLASRQIR